MRRTLFAILHIFILLVACAPAASTRVASTATPLPMATALPIVTAFPTSTPTMMAAPTNTPTPTATLAPTATPRPQARVITDTVLYEGPSNFGYKELAILPKDAQATPLAVFGDFYQVQWTSHDGKSQTGFVVKNNLQQNSLPNSSEIKALTLDQVSPIAISLKKILRPGTDSARTLEINNTKDNAYLRFNSGGAIKLDGKFTLQFNLDGRGGINLVGVKGVNDDLFIEANSLYVAVAPSKKNMMIQLVDGRSGNPEIQLSTIKPGGTFTIEFGDAQGKSFQIFDAQGKSAFSMEVAKDAKYNMPNGVFPKNEMFLGVLIPPAIQLNVNSLAILMPPSGKELAQAPNIEAPLVLPPLPEGMRGDFYHNFLGTGVNSSVMAWDKFFYFYGKPLRIAVDDANNIQVTVTTNTYENRTKTVTLAPNKKVTLKTKHIADQTLSGGRVRGQTWGSDITIFSSNQPIDIFTALNHYVELLKNKGIDCTFELRANNEDFAPGDQGVFEIFLYYSGSPGNP